MGKGRIIIAQGEGLYTIEIIEDRARAESNRASAAQRVTELDQRIADAQAEVETLQDAVDDSAQEQNQAIDLHQQQIAADGESDVDLAAYAVAVIEAAANRDRKRIEIGQMQADRLALQTRIERIDSLPPLRQLDAWCADYTEDLSGEVATAEVPGEIGQVIIKPGFDGNTWSAAADGVIQPAISGTPAGVFYNLAMLPGWQKWRPTFRIATISNITTDTGDITLVPAASSQQGLNVNMASAYDGVPIMYMDCDGDAFEEGDRVLVAFSGNAGQPVVVGFEQAPRECDECECEPTILGTSPSSGTWQVLDIFGTMPVEACPEDEWRIVTKADGYLTHSGLLREEDGTFYLDGLPEELPARFRKVVGSWYGCSWPDVPTGQETEFWITMPIPDPVFHDGFWGFVGTSGGDGGTILSNGDIYAPFYFEVITEYYFIWSDGAGCGTVELVYTSPTNQYELQLGCKQGDGSVQWPG